ncbi:MAG: methylenetetrahydrofolate reductase [Gammaproteobacteria bacterium]|nr:methylenetetrahydrofolate reductase [Gammaproteobacteria bacterium]
MKVPTMENEHSALLRDLREAYMEIFPAPGIEEKLQVLEPNAYVAVTCSPTKGIGETLDLTENIVGRGFRVVPHIAAKNVRDMDHLGEIIRRLNEVKIDSLFVPGGDRAKPIGEFSTAFELLRAIDEFDHNFSQIGVAAHPEGHPDIDDDTLFDELLKKQKFANYMVTQMCFDAELLGAWLLDLRSRGITMPVWIGLPGVIDRSRLIRTSFRIGVGDSLRFLRKKTNVVARLLSASIYKPDDLVLELARYQADPVANIVGYHLFCFNQIETTERWRQQSIESLE